MHKTGVVSGIDRAIVPKLHLPVLDGLRGIAAISVVMIHFQELTVGLNDPDSFWFRHAYLAVDFFFCLSGFVLAYAYDDRRDSMGIQKFLVARLIRLHPMVVFGVALGLLSYICDPFNRSGNPAPWIESQQAPAWKLFGCAVGSLFMVPTWALPNRFGSYFSLNAPSWSLMWEYAASLAYALVLWRVRNAVLACIVAVSALAIAIATYDSDTLALGFGWGQMIYALIRVSFSFCLGVLLFRLRVRRNIAAGFVLLSALLLLLFWLPGWGNSESGDVPLNWLYDLSVVMFAFPVIVLIGAAASVSGRVGKVCDFCGRISYPIYMIHYAFILVFVDYVWTRAITGTALYAFIVASTISMIAVSYAILVAYDEPLRRQLNMKVKARACPIPALP